ncbi:MAG: rhomboid family intramembrane serine protease [Candidatus Omnitrophica bacterium]|nr:rhomboid family intramembrane serine protease [Candidatus Omnitrophota bacterium]
MTESNFKFEYHFQPWVTILSAGWCLLVFGLLQDTEIDSWEEAAKFGHYSARAIWDGAYWALITSAFVHYEVWHLIFNVYWLWKLGSEMEKTIGSIRYLVFILVAAFVSSSFQLAVSDDTGIGFSGVGYGIFGFMWLSRDRYPSFKKVLDSQIVSLFLVWLVFCFVITKLGIWQVGNAAHLSGLIFGGLVAFAFTVKSYRRLSQAGLIALIALSWVPLFWCPWSTTWLGKEAYAAHSEGRYEEALDYYNRIIKKDPYNAWAYSNRADINRRLGKYVDALRDERKAAELDPSYANSE